MSRSWQGLQPLFFAQEFHRWKASAYFFIMFRALSCSVILGMPEGSAANSGSCSILLVFLDKNLSTVGVPRQQNMLGLTCNCPCLSGVTDSQPLYLTLAGPILGVVL